MAVTPAAGALAVEEASVRPYAEATNHLRRDHRIQLSKHTLEKVTQTVGQYWLDHDQHAYEQLEQATRKHGLPQGAEGQPDKCTIFADGVMVHTDGAWHEARVGVVRSEHGEHVQNVKQRSIVRLSDPHDFGHHIWTAAAQGGCHQAKLCAFIADGSHWLWRLCDRHFDHAIRILDFYHLAEHVHRCAAVHFGEGAEQARDWALATLGTLRAGEVDAALQRVEALDARGKLKRQAKHELVTYLTNNRQRMNYPRYEALGLPIGSGRVEAACKTLVQKRCKQAGMRWSRDGLERLLRVRCEVVDDTYRLRFGHWPTNLTAWQKRRQAA